MLFDEARACCALWQPLAAAHRGPGADQQPQSCRSWPALDSAAPDQAVPGSVASFRGFRTSGCARSPSRSDRRDRRQRHGASSVVATHCAGCGLPMAGAESPRLIRRADSERQRPSALRCGLSGRNGERRVKRNGSGARRSSADCHWSIPPTSA
jgi:hypothetical protein